MSNAKAKVIYRSSVPDATTESGYKEFDLMVDNMRRIVSAGFHKYSWTKETSETRFGEKLRAWGKDAAQYDVTIKFEGNDREEMLNDFHDATEYDIISNSPGTLIWEEYSIKCFIISSETQPYSSTEWPNATSNTVTIYCPSPWWTRAIKFRVYENPDEIPEQDAYIVSGAEAFTRYWLSATQGGQAFKPSRDLKYLIKTAGEYYNHYFRWVGTQYQDTTPETEIKEYEDGYDYEFDYMIDEGSSSYIENELFVPTNFIITIYGPVNNPSIAIRNEHQNESQIYNINVNVADGDKLVIDAINKTVILHQINGTKINCFGARNADYYLWEQIKSGINYLTWTGYFIFEVELVEERSEPKWITD